MTNEGENSPLPRIARLGSREPWPKAILAEARPFLLRLTSSLMTPWAFLRQFILHGWPKELAQRCLTGSQAQKLETVWRPLFCVDPSRRQMSQRVQLDSGWQ